MDGKPDTKTLTNEQVSRLGFEIYDRELEPHLEATETRRWVAIHLTTHEYFVGKDAREAALNALKKHPGELLFVTRVGG